MGSRRIKCNLSESFDAVPALGGNASVAPNATYFVLSLGAGKTGSKTGNLS